MNCSKFETDVTLYAGGDLPAERMARIEGHLAECENCRALADDLRIEQALLNEMRDEPLEDAMVAQVRRRVLAEIRETSWRAGFSRRGALAPLLALAAALVLTVILLWPRHEAKQAPVARIKPAPVAPSAPEIIGIHRRTVRTRHRRAPAAQPGQPLLVQFVTDDPNIVIYWLVDQKNRGD